VVLVVLRLPSLSAVTAQCGEGLARGVFSEVSDGEGCLCELAFLVLIVGRGFGRCLERWLPVRRRLLALGPRHGCRTEGGCCITVCFD